MPVWSAAPCPRLIVWRNATAPPARACAWVSSREPSSTSTVGQPSRRTEATTSRITLPSLKAAITTHVPVLSTSLTNRFNHASTRWASTVSVRNSERSRGMRQGLPVVVTGPTMLDTRCLKASAARVLRALFWVYAAGTFAHIAYVVNREPYAFDAWNVTHDTGAQPF